MRKIVYVLALALTVPMLATAQSTWTENTKGSWKGLVVEYSCYMSDPGKATAADHQACALDCVKKGKPLAIVTDDDGVRRIIGDMSKDNYAKMIPWIGKRVAVTGESSRDAFSALYIEIKTIAAAK